MNNCVSYQVAWQLKEAGFPEPHHLMSSDVEVFAYNPAISQSHAWLITLPLFDYHVFAPTISDILPLIENATIYHYSSDGFICDLARTRHRSNNIHDAAALAWLHQNHK